MNEFQTPDTDAAESVSPTKRGIIPVGGPIAGPAHDRVLCSTTALVTAVGASRGLIGNGFDPLSVWAMGLYLGFAMMGYGIGMRVPAEHRAMLQAGCTAVLSLVGVGTIAGMGPM